MKYYNIKVLNQNKTKSGLKSNLTETLTRVKNL